MANSSLGTAWIQIKPSLSGVATEIKKELTGVSAQGGTAIENSLNKSFSVVGKNLKSTFSDAFDSVKSSVSKILTTGLGSTFAALTAQVGSAVSRIDTLNNAPRVFQAMGYSVESVNATMDYLNSYLDGLPTSLDTAVTHVQTLAASFGGIENGTKYFTAMNDAGLAFGATSEQIENAIMQLSQTSLDGPLDAATWNSLRNSGFEPVFAAMAEQAGVTVGELKEQFGGNGTKTVQDFLDALVDLDQNGTASMSSLQEMARANTDGIATSFANAKTAITRGLADVISSIPGLSDSILDVGKTVEKVLKGDMDTTEAAQRIQNDLSGILTGIGNIAEKMVPLVLQTLPGLINQIVDGICNFLSDEERTSMLIDGFVELVTAVAVGAARIAEAILPLIPEIIGKMVEAFTSEENAGILAGGLGILFGGAVLKSIPEFVSALNLAKTAISGVGTALNFLSDNPIVLIIAAVVALVAAIVTFLTQTEEGQAILGAFGEFLGGIFAWVGEVIGGICEIVGEVATAVGEFFSWVGEIIGEVVGNVVTSVSEFFSWIGEIIGTAAQWVWDTLLGPIVDFVTNCVTVIIAIWATIIEFAYNIISTIIGAVANFIGEVIGAVAGFIDGVMTVVGVIAGWVWDNVISPVIDFCVGMITTIVDGVTGFVSTVMDVIGVIADWVWNNVLNPIINFVNNVINAIVGGVTGFVGTVTSIIGTIANWINANVIQPVANFFNGLWEGIKTGVQAVKSVIEGIFSTIAGIVKAPFNGIIGAINGVIDTINGITVPDWVPIIGGAHASFPHIPTLASGGAVWGAGTATSDSIPALLSNGEYVIKAAVARDVGYNNLDHLNETGELRETKIAQQFIINGYNKDPQELANIISRKIAFNQGRQLA